MPGFSDSFGDAVYQNIKGHHNQALEEIPILTSSEKDMKFLKGIERMKSEITASLMIPGKCLILNSEIIWETVSQITLEERKALFNLKEKILGKSNV